MTRTKVDTLYSDNLGKRFISGATNDDLLKNCDALAARYHALPATSVAKKDKQLVFGAIVLFEHETEYVVFRYFAGTRDRVCSYVKDVDVYCIQA